MNDIVFISRDDAMELIAWKKLVLLSSYSRKQIIYDIMSHAELSDEEQALLDPLSDLHNEEIIKYLKSDLLIVTNEYLGDELKELYRKDFSINGEPLLYERCPCCGFRTIPEYGNYDICSNCFWEDDGSRDLEKYSSANHMTLQEGRDNYIQFNACATEFVNLVEVNKKKYLR